MTSLRRKTCYRLMLSVFIGMTAAFLCYRFRLILYPGPGDFNWALDTARALVNRNNPYDFTPSALKVPYPLPVAIFGLPFLMLPGPIAAALFFGCTSVLLAYGILAHDTAWRLLVFCSFPYIYALMFAQWSPLITASWFFPTLAPLLTLIKPNIALPVALNRSNRSGWIIALVVLLTFIMVYPMWPITWFRMTRNYEAIIPIFSLPFGPILLLAIFRWRVATARLLIGMAILPFRGVYDLVPLWLIPQGKWQIIAFCLLSWLVPLLDLQLAFSIRTHWAIPILFIPALIFIYQNALNGRKELLRAV